MLRGNQFVHLIKFASAFSHPLATKCQARTRQPNDQMSVGLSHSASR
jgi:hypothetical protein